jgi:hypothetical protein
MFGSLVTEVLEGGAEGVAKGPSDNGRVVGHEMARDGVAIE